MISVLICPLVLASAWATFIPHEPPEEPVPFDPYSPLHFMLGLHKNPHNDELPVPFGIHGHVSPSDDDELDEKLPRYPEGPPKAPKMDNSKQGAQVINNYLIFAKELKKLFDAKNGALQWDPPAESTKREKFEHGKESKLPEKVIPYQMHSPPITGKVEHSEYPDFLTPLLQREGQMLIRKIFELELKERGLGATGPATPVTEEFPKQEKYEDHPPVDQNSETETEEKLPPELVDQQSSAP